MTFNEIANQFETALAAISDILEAGALSLTYHEGKLYLMWGDGYDKDGRFQTECVVESYEIPIQTSAE